MLPRAVREHQAAYLPLAAGQDTLHVPVCMKQAEGLTCLSYHKHGDTFVFLLSAQYNNKTRLRGQAGVSGLKKCRTVTSSSTRAKLSGQGRSRAVAVPWRTQASRGCAGMRANIVTKSGLKEAFSFALACEQTGLLGHRCKSENTGLKARIKWRTRVLQVLWNRNQATKPARHCCRLTDSQWSVCLGPSKDSCGISMRIAMRNSATWKRRRTEHLGVFSFSVISTQTVLVWPATPSGGQPSTSRREVHQSPPPGGLLPSHREVVVSAGRKIHGVWSQSQMLPQHKPSPR